MRWPRPTRSTASGRAGRCAGPLHGIPVLLKDNIDTGDRMPPPPARWRWWTRSPPRDAFLVERLREAGAVLLGKTNLSEWANFRSRHSSSGWSGRGGQWRNPYALDRNPSRFQLRLGRGRRRQPLRRRRGHRDRRLHRLPSASTALVGIKPTVGLISRAGIIPISHSQDTAGPDGPYGARRGRCCWACWPARDPATRPAAEGARFDVRSTAALDAAR